MRRRKKRSQPEPEAKVDVTSLLDIIFIMLIFFIVTTSFVKESGFLVKKAGTNKATQKEATSIMIHIDQHGIVYFNNKAVDIIRLPARIEYYIANNPTEHILVRPHAETSHQKVVEVLDQISPFKRLKISIGIYKP
ncbi:biopolymer transporter ExbD [Thalassomonas viridans]|uniref:Biopolymer transporter ExbD n=1 Tax=Thalassomonas viridans TaxID=137584 RepID=A0AAE9Z2R7_9GAMM|nr:biopolymer transporter ExbD [Thalassomonas viridans]WDE04142.1 biopolymer transporter ExbD [Thalassomonas viridans]